MIPGSIGPLEIVLVLVIALVVLGPKKMPDMARSIGKGMRDFKDAVSGVDPRNEREDAELLSDSSSPKT